MSQYEGKTCLVLGGSGMLGSYLCDKLIEERARVEVIDIQMGYCPKSASLWICDIAEYPQAVGLRIKELKPDYVFNCAAKVTGITYNEGHHCTMAIENSLLTTIPLNACRNLDCRYVYLSTACVYPPDASIPTPEHEASAMRPEDTNLGYGWAKLFGEWLHFWAYEENPSFRPLVLRPSNMYSPREHFDDPDAHVIPRTIYRLLSGEDPMVIRGTGDATRSFLHARDAADGIVRAAATDVVDTLNLAASPETEISIRDLMNSLCMVTDQFPEIQWDESANEGYPRRVSCTKKFVEAVGEWNPPTSLKGGLAETVRACLDTISESRTMAVTARSTF